MINRSSHSSGSDGDWLRQLRQAHGLHQHQLAAKLDINQGRVSEWERDLKPIPEDRLAQIKEILN